MVISILTELICYEIVEVDFDVIVDDIFLLMLASVFLIRFLALPFAIVVLVLALFVITCQAYHFISIINYNIIKNNH